MNHTVSQALDRLFLLTLALGAAGCSSLPWRQSAEDVADAVRSHNEGRAARSACASEVDPALAMRCRQRNEVR